MRLSDEGYSRRWMLFGRWPAPESSDPREGLLPRCARSTHVNILMSCRNTLTCLNEGKGVRAKSESTPVTVAALDEEVRPSPLAKTCSSDKRAARAASCLPHRTARSYTLGAGSIHSASSRPSAPPTSYRRRLLLLDELEKDSFCIRLITSLN